MPITTTYDLSGCCPGCGPCSGCVRPSVWPTTLYLTVNGSACGICSGAAAVAVSGAVDVSGGCNGSWLAQGDLFTGCSCQRPFVTDRVTVDATNHLMPDGVTPGVRIIVNVRCGQTQRAADQVVACPAAPHHVTVDLYAQDGITVCGSVRITG